MTASILNGVSDIFDNWLGLAGNSEYGSKKDVPKYNSKTAAKALSGNGGPLTSSGCSINSAEDAISQAMCCLEANIEMAKTKGFKAADSNWRWEKSLDLSEKNKSPEKVFEKVVTFLLGETWVNQIPTCNGLVPEGASACRIDLARRIKKCEHYELIELKFGLTEENSGSNYPLYAAMEILEYGLLYIAFRKHCLLGNRLEQRHELLLAKTIDLVVLAPCVWYRVNAQTTDLYNFSWLETSIIQGIKDYLTKSEMADLNMPFRFEMLPKEYTTAFNRLMVEINACRDDALHSRRALYAKG